MKSNSHFYSDIDKCNVIDLPRRIGENGCLTEVENVEGMPFKTQRVYYLYDIPADSDRGGHSHYEAESLLVAVSGAFDVTIDDGHKKKTVTLNRPYQALYLQKGIWRTLENFSSGSVCLVINSEKYDEEDYVRDYDEFLKLTKRKAYINDVIKYPFLELGKVNAPYMEQLKQAAAKVIESGRYIGGSEVEALEQKMCDVCGTPYAVGVSTGLDALRLIFRAYIQLGRLQRGDEVIVPADTFIASVLAITDNGLKPVFVDPSLSTYNLDADRVEEAITERTKAILPVHLYGRVCWDERLKDIIGNNQLIVVEDNAQAIGAVSPVMGMYDTYRSGGLGNAGAMSFYPTKNVGALGDAGIVTTHDKDVADCIRALRNYGSDRQYHNIYAGLNCRLDPIQAAMLMVKLPYLDEENAHRRTLAAVYDKCIVNPLVVKPCFPDQKYALGMVWHQYVVRVKNREKFRNFLLENGVETNVHYPLPPHKQPCYSEYYDISLPVAEKIAAEVVSLPVSSCTSEDDARIISEIVNNYVD